VREIEQNVIEEARFAQRLVVIQFSRVDVVENGLAFVFEVLDVLFSLGFVLFEQFGLTVVACCRDVAAAVVFDY
jgi:hypothetical protein